MGLSMDMLLGHSREVLLADTARNFACHWIDLTMAPKSSVGALNSNCEEHPLLLHLVQTIIITFYVRMTFHEITAFMYTNQRMSDLILS